MSLSCFHSVLHRGTTLESDSPESDAGLQLVIWLADGAATRVRVTIAPIALLDDYARKTPRSQALHERAKSLLCNGVTHIGRYMEPHPIYVDRAAGSHKWDVDGNEYVDYFGGHGASWICLAASLRRSSGRRWTGAGRWV